MKVLKWMGIIFGVLLVLFVGVGLLLSKKYEVSRSVTVAADKARVHTFVDDLEKWPLWEPWREMDATIKVTLGPKTSGVGARQSWSGNSGDGSLTFMSSSPEKGIAYDLHFEKGKYKCVGSMRYESQGDKTKVTWAMVGENPIPVVGGYMAVLMDSMVGPMFENGLNKLKAEAEKADEPKAKPEPEPAGKE